MLAYLIRRLVQTVLVLLAVTLIVFLMMSFTGDPVFMLVPIDSQPEVVAAARARLGLDQPLPVQYLRFLGNLLSGDFGVSYVFRQPALSLILERLPATLEIVFVAIVVALLVAIPLGVHAGARPQAASSRTVMTGSLLGISLPGFWVGMMLILVFAVQLRWLPSSGRGDTVDVFGVPISIATRDGLAHVILPAVTLSLSTTAILLRMTRAGMQEVMRQDFMRFARAKGVSRQGVIWRHGLRNALSPVVTIFGLQVGDLIAFATITETIFSWPGIGKLLIDSIARADRPVIVVYLMLVATMFVLINFVVDMLYPILDPRIRAT
ncbi:ABC transporter permease [Paracoccus suum]|uniref:ABC transporter permease n=1 Tax=Paracoccus suum TaxID=2259340 RepID=A0A344PMI4_9RHOB|nr:ABC transporter permease [Paracoccus suum]AXC50589.1 ABC transporter permease [Paracoccus suum]